MQSGTIIKENIYNASIKVWFYVATFSARVRSVQEALCCIITRILFSDVSENIKLQHLAAYSFSWFPVQPPKNSSQSCQLMWVSVQPRNLDIPWW